jgi:hypothetical protein
MTRSAAIFATSGAVVSLARLDAVIPVHRDHPDARPTVKLAIRVVDIRAPVRHDDTGIDAQGS